DENVEAEGELPVRFAREIDRSGRLEEEPGETRAVPSCAAGVSLQPAIDRLDHEPARVDRGGSRADDLERRALLIVAEVEAPRRGWTRLVVDRPAHRRPRLSAFLGESR